MSSTNYSHPYISIQIFDNTEYMVEETITERKEFNGMQVGFFAGGRDNKLLYMPNRTLHLREFGNPNYAKLGQAAYNVDNALATGNCGMYVMNLRPDDATHANVVVMVRFKVAEETAQKPEEGTTSGETGIPSTEEPTVTKKLVYSFYAKYIEGASTEALLLKGALNLMQTDPDENGYYNMPLIVFYSLGRGVYGNDIRLKFANVTTYVEDDAFIENDLPTEHRYSLTVMEASKSGLSTREVNTGTFDVDGFDAYSETTPSTFLSDVINDIEYGSERIKCELYSSTLDAICALYNAEVAPDAKATPYSLDILTGLTLEGTINEKLSLDTTAEDYLNLFSLDGFVLKAGIDGFVGLSGDDLVNAKNALLIKAYNGDIDPYIKSRFSSPCNFNLDANYDVDVKKQMAALANSRMYDCMTYIDTGLVSTTSGLLNTLAGLKSVYGFNVIKECHSYKWRDSEYTGKICNMTITHWLAKKLPNHMVNDNGLSIPMARGEAILTSGTDYLPNTFVPVIDPDSDSIKDTIYKLRANCYQTLSYNSVQRSTAITSCQKNSDRLLEMNEYILQRAVSVVYDIMQSKLYKLGEANDRNRFEEDATDILNYRLSGYVRSAAVEFEMTMKDEKRSLLRLILHLTFKTVVQNGEVKIYLDPRVTDEAVVTSASGVTSY